MAIALVGTIGAVSTGASGAAVTPAWGTNETRTASNLLILWVESTGSLTLPAAPGGWTLAKQLANTQTSTASIFYRVSSGGESAPTVAAITSTVLSCQLAEFSGAATNPVVDQSASGASTALSALTITLGAADVAAGDLLIASSCAEYASTTGTKTDVISSNNATMTNTTNSAAVADIYAFAYGVTTSNAAADTAVATYYTSHTPNVALVAVSFRAAPAPNVTGINQAAGAYTNSQVSGLATLAVTNVTLGDYRILAFKIASTSFTVSGVTGGGVNNWHYIGNILGSNTHDVELWGGVVTATGAVTITATYSASNTVNTALWSSELVWTGGAPPVWEVVAFGSVNGASATSWNDASLTSAGAAQCYWGFAQVNAIGAPGSTTGFTYSAASTIGDIACFDGTLAATTTYAPNFTCASAVTATLVGAIIQAGPAPANQRSNVAVMRAGNF